MPVDIYYDLKEGAVTVTLAEAQRRFIEAGMACTIEPDPEVAEMSWFIFEPHSTTTICVSIAKGRVVFATVHAAYNDKPKFAETVDQVLESIGLSSGDQT